MPTTYKLIAKSILTSDTGSVTFSGIPNTYTDLSLVASTRQSDSVITAQYYVQFNSDTTASYTQRYMQGYGSGSSTLNTTSLGVFTVTAGNTATSGTFGSAEFYVPNYANAVVKSISVHGVGENNAQDASIMATAAVWSKTAAITSVTFVPTASTNFRSGSSFFIYGITKA